MTPARAPYPLQELSDSEPDFAPANLPAEAIERPVTHPANIQLANESVANKDPASREIEIRAKRGAFGSGAPGRVTTRPSANKRQRAPPLTNAFRSNGSHAS